MSAGNVRDRLMDSPEHRVVKRLFDELYSADGTPHVEGTPTPAQFAELNEYSDAVEAHLTAHAPDFAGLPVTAQVIQHARTLDELCWMTGRLYIGWHGSGRPKK